jgi:hypothetical protein
MRWLPTKKFFVIFLVIHAAASTGLAAASLSMVMERFDSGTPEGPLESFIVSTSQVLLSPLFNTLRQIHLISIWFSGLSGWLLVLANSALWALVVWWLGQGFIRLRRRSS